MKPASGGGLMSSGNGNGLGSSKESSGGMGSPSQTIKKPKTLVCYIW
jgi:hypothetical protein